MSGIQCDIEKRKADRQDAERRDALRRRSRGESGRLEHFVEKERNALRQDAKLADAVKSAGES